MHRLRAFRGERWSDWTGALPRVVARRHRRAVGIGLHAFKPGWKGGPGRPIGSRSKLSETMLALLNAEAVEHGAAVIAEVRKTKPHVWLQVMASLLPKQVSIERLSPFADLSDDEIDQLERYLTASRAQQVTELNGKAIELEPSDAKQRNKP